MRLFVSVRPSPEAVVHLADHLRGAHSSRADQWHVTLVFLGELGSAEPLLPGLLSVAASHAAFDLRLAGGGAFGRASWAGVDGDVASLRGLAADVQVAARLAGVLVGARAYRPHLTVGRVPTARLTGYRGPPWQVQEIELVHSVLGQRVVHTVVGRFPLQPRDYQA